MAIFRLVGIRGALQDTPDRPFMGDHATFPRQGDELVDENGNPISFSSMVGVPFDLVIDQYSMDTGLALLWFDSESSVLRLSVKYKDGRFLEMEIDDTRKFMLKSVYDTNEDGVVNSAESLAYISGETMYVVPAETVRTHLENTAIHFVIDDPAIRTDAAWSSSKIFDFTQETADWLIDHRIQDYAIDRHLLWSSEQIWESLQGLAPLVHTHDASQIVSGVLSYERLPIFIGTDGIHAGYPGAVPTPLPNELDYFLRADGTWGYIADARFDIEDSVVGQGVIFNGFSYRRTTFVSGQGLQIDYNVYDDTLTFSAGRLDQLQDVDIVYPEAGEVLMYDVQAWADFKFRLLGLQATVDLNERTMTIENTGVVVAVGEPVDAPPGTIWIIPDYSE